MQNNSFISEVYLKKMIKKVKSAAIEKFMRGISSWYADVKNEIVRNVSDEEYELEDYIDDLISPVLSSLGYKYSPVKSLMDQFLLFADSSKQFKVATLYATHYSVDICKEEKGNFPGFYAVKLAKEQGVRWAMLTNGIKWRIYDVKANSPYETYIEADLARLVTDPIDNYDINHKVFMLFFEAHTFFKESNQAESVIEKYLKDSEKEIQKQEKILKDKIEGILKEICYGFMDSIGQSEYSKEDRQQIFEDAIILLYRLLFIQYAEARELLPVSNEIYSETSLTRLALGSKEQINNGEIVEIANEYSLWKKFDSLRGYINLGWDDIDMVAYNGGLFDNEEHRILREHSLENSYFATVLSELSYIKNKNGKYEEKFEYRDLTVRNLGSLYEGLLEYNLYIAEEPLVRRTTKGKTEYVRVVETTIKKNERNNIIDVGQIYFSQNATERKDTGSYYTPEDVVNYIVINTLGKKLDEIKKDFIVFFEHEKALLELAVTKNELISIQKQIDERIMKYIEKSILSISILDSSMGSGHFLVNATYYLANFIVELIHMADWKNNEIPIDIPYWKIKVVSHCIYGIDINPLAVHLGKLSLWLISAAKNKPLTFIDHHLKTGNSLIGTSKDEIESKVKEWTNNEFNLFTISYEDSLNSVINKYDELAKMPESTRDDVHRKKELYELIEEELQVLKYKYDIYLAQKLNTDVINKEEFLSILSMDSLEEIERTVWDNEKLFKLIKNNRHFHWELEFPDVFWTGGFDVSLGNPPYVELKDCNYTPTVECIGNLYTSFVMQSISNSSEKGFVGYIVPMSSICTDRTGKFQKFIGEELGNLKISNFAWRPGKIFDGVNLQVSIITGEKNHEKKSILTTTYNMWKPEQRNYLFDNLKFIDATECIIFDSIPKIGSDIEKSILEKMFSIEKVFKDFLEKGSPNEFYYRRGGLYYKIFTNFRTYSSEEKILRIKTNLERNVPIAMFNSSTWFWFFTVYSDCRHVALREIEKFPVDFDDMDMMNYNKLANLGQKLNEDYLINAIETKRVYKSVKTVECINFQAKDSIHIIDEIDDVIGDYYGFNKEEIEFLKNYKRDFRVYDNE